MPPSRPDGLAHVLWLGGSACAGKSVAARALAAAHGLTLYSCDERFEEHRRRASPERHPHFHKLMDLPLEALWLLPVATQARDLLRFYEDELTMIFEDLRDLPGPVLAEGVGLLPAGVAEVLADRRRACWLIATAGFRREHYRQREAVLAELFGCCPDPQRVFGNAMARDDEIASHLAREAAALSLSVRRIDGGSTEAETAAELARHFRLAP